MLEKINSSSILEFVQSISLLRNVCLVPSNEIKNNEIDCILEGVTAIKGKDVVLRIVFDKFFPIHKPLFFLKEPNSLGFIPHVDKSGSVCYSQNEGIVLDSTNPQGIINESFQKVLSTLEKGVSGENKEDFYLEFESYWNLQENLLCISSIVTTLDKPKKIIIAKKNNTEFFIADDDISINNFCNGKLSGKCTYVNAFYIPFTTSLDILPPKYGQCWSYKEVKKILIFWMNDREAKKIVKPLLANPKTTEYLIFDLIISDSRNALFGIKISNIKCNISKRKRGKITKSPLLDKKVVFSPIKIDRYDKKYLVSRGGDGTILDNKRVLLIGCGSVGGHIALELARSGISSITLVDKETLSKENIYRHVLGFNYCDQAKSKALKSEIEKKIPHIKITSIEDSIENVLGNENFVISQWDLVIVALGDPTIELYLNKVFHKEEKMPPFIFTWLEAYGIGGHALLSNNNTSGCFQCLYRDINEINVLYNLASFAKEKQNFAKSLSGCGGEYTPYSSIATNKTAIIATELAIDLLLEKEKDNPLISWKGDSFNFTKKYELSPRYSLNKQQLFERRYLYKDKNCQICKQKCHEK